jgi:DNA-binding XRE family transcriptional regulator
MDQEIREFFARAAYYNIKQYQIAKRAGIQPGTISAWNKKDTNPHWRSFKKATVALEELIEERA